MTTLEYHLTKFQRIYELALARPQGGYAASRLFKRSPIDCPNCHGSVYTRLRGTTGTPIGAVCSECGWKSTFRQRPSLPTAPVQPNLL